jgi:hypothetical protein
LFFIFLLSVAQHWTKHVEPRMAALTAVFDRFSRSWGRDGRWPLKEKDGILPIASGKELSA